MTHGKPPVLVAVIHDVLNHDTFDTLTDLADATKWRAAALRIPYDGGTVSEALAMVARTRPPLRRPVTR